MENADELSKITTILFENPNSLTSEDFLKAYNIIHSFCTKITKDYEIKGRQIYELLQEKVGLYTSNLSSVSSVEEFNTMMVYFDKSVMLIRKVYSYLERYFIRISLDRRDGYVQDIETLCYSYFYRNFIERIENVLCNLILLEIDVLRKSCMLVRPDKNHTNKHVRESIRSALLNYKKLLAYSDEDRKYTKFKNSYLDNFIRTTDFKGNIRKLTRIIDREIEIQMKIFEIPTFYDVASKIVNKISNRVDEVIKLAITKVRADRPVEYLYRILRMVGDRALEKFYEAFKSMTEDTAEKLKTFTQFLNAYVFIEKSIEKNFLSDNFLKELLFNSFKRYFNNNLVSENNQETGLEKNLDFKEEIILEIERTMLSFKKNSYKVGALLSFVKMIDNKESLKEKLTHGIQRRLLFDLSDLMGEQVLVLGLRDKTSNEYVSKALRSTKDIAISSNYGCFIVSDNYTVVKNRLPDEEPVPFGIFRDEFTIKPKYLTKGFWNIEPTKMTLADPLVKFLKNIKDQHLLKIPRSVIEFNHRISPIYISIDDISLRISTDKASLLLFLDKHGSLTYEKLKDMSNDDRLTENLEFLVKNNLINHENNFYELNLDYGRKIENKNDLVNLFEDFYDSYEYVPMKNKISENISKEKMFQAKIVAILKRNKKMDKNALLKEICDFHKIGDNVFNEILEDLADKEYVYTENDNVFYIP